MKQTLCTVAFLSLGLLTMPTSASAQCVQSDISIQASITGSRTPANQSSRTNMRSRGPCSGTTTHTQGVQTTTGGRSAVNQTRRVDQEITAGSGNGTGINVPPVQVRSNAQINVYNAAD